MARGVLSELDRVHFREMQMARLTTLDRIALVLLIIGGINWGLVGGFDINLVTQLFGPRSLPSRLIYIAVGAAAVYAIYLLARGAPRRS
jgi:uncharacterized membrane protein YuzA (DUF378 family)